MRPTRPGPASRLEVWTPALAREWDELAVASGATPFARPGWIDAMREAFFPEADLGLVTVRDDGELVALLPVLQHGRTVVSPTNVHSPCFEIVARGPSDVRRLAAAVAGLPVHRIDLQYLEGEQADVLARAVQARGGLAVRRPVQSSLRVDTSRPWAQVQAGLSSNLRKGARRSARRLAERGQVSWHLHVDGQDLNGLLAEGFRVEASGWKGAAGTAIASRPETLLLYTRVARWAAEHGLLRLNVLRLDGRAVAFDLNIAQAGVLYSLKTGYDAELAACSPGTLNFLSLTEHACHDPELTAIEMLGDESDWKRRLTGDACERVALTAFLHPRLQRAQCASHQLSRWGRSVLADRLPAGALRRAVQVQARLSRHPVPRG